MAAVAIPPAAAASSAGETTVSVHYVQRLAEEPVEFMEVNSITNVGAYVGAVHCGVITPSRGSRMPEAMGITRFMLVPIPCGWL